jgi:O-antigen ligase
MFFERISLVVSLLDEPFQQVFRLKTQFAHSVGHVLQSEDCLRIGAVAAIGSQVQRQELFKKSLYITITHPLLVVGPDQFAVAVAGDSAKQGVHSPSLGTHNSYTQVSSECGIPAFICWCAVLVLLL